MSNGNNNYYVGQRVLVEMQFRLLGVPVDPSIVQITSKAPNGTSSTLVYPAATLIRKDTGLFEASIILTVAGSWWFRGEGDGGVDALTEIGLSVLPSNVI